MTDFFLMPEGGCFDFLNHLRMKKQAGQQPLLFFK